MDTWWMIAVSIFASLGTSLAAVGFVIRNFAGHAVVAEDDHSTTRLD